MSEKNWGFITEESKEYSTFRARKFYKYFSFNEFTLDSLSKNKIWVSHPESFNDPFDSTIRISDQEHNKKVYRLMLDYLKMVAPIPSSQEEYAGSELQWISELEDEMDEANFEAPILTDILKHIRQRDALMLFYNFVNRSSESIPSLNAFLKNYIDLGVCCFSKSFYSPTMWAHYADHHCGFCVEYD